MNKYYGQQYMVDAAASLAKIVKDTGKPVAFDLIKYITLLPGAGIPDKPVPQVITDFFEKRKSVIISDPAIISEVFAHAEHQAAATQDRFDFATSLGIAFGIEEVQAVLPCILAEIGWTAAYTGSREWIYLVFPEPKPADCNILDL